MRTTGQAVAKEQAVAQDQMVAQDQTVANPSSGRAGWRVCSAPILPTASQKDVGQWDNWLRSNVLKTTEQQPQMRLYIFA
jgi:hypothetical protein